MMRATVTLMLAILSTGIAHARTLELIEGAYELMLGDVSLPTSAVGAVTFRQCQECDVVRLQVGSGTRYVLGRSELPFADFLAAVEGIKQTEGAAAEAAVGVFYDLDSKRVTRITVSTGR